MTNAFPYIVIRRAGLPFEILSGFRGDFLALEKHLADACEKLNDAATEVLDVFDEVLSGTPESPFRTKVYNARKLFFQKKKITDFPENVAISTAFEQYKTAHQNAAAAQTAFEHNWETTILHAYQHLREIAQNPSLQRGLLFSSLDLLQQIPHFIQVDPSQFSRKERNIALSLVKYITRMAANTTPLSQFAGIGVLEKDERPKVFSGEDFPDESSNLRFETDFLKAPVETVKITPNVAILDGIYSILLQQPVFYRSLKVVLNPMITGVETQKYTWWHYNGEAEAIQEVPVGGAVQFIVDHLVEHQRVYSFSELAVILSEATDVVIDASENYVLELIDFGLLSWELPEHGLSPSWSSRLYQYLGFMQGGSMEPVITDTAFLLHWLRSAARTLPFQPVETAQETLRDTAEQIKNYFGKYADNTPPIPTEQLFYEEVSCDTKGAETSAVYWDFAQKLLHLWQQISEKPYTGLRAKISRCLDNGPLTLAQLSRILVTLPDEAATTLPVPVSTAGFPIGFFFQVFQERDGQKKAVFNAAFPGGGRMIARWLHLFPEAVTLALQQYLQQFPNLHEFTWYNRFNANFHPDLLKKRLAMPDGYMAHKGVLAGNIRVHKNDAGQILLIDQSSGAQINLIDPGLEEMYSRPAFVQAILFSGLPRIETDLMRNTVWKAQTNEYATKSREEVSGIILQREAWRFSPGFWKSCASLSGFAFFAEIRLKLKEAGLPTLVFVSGPKVKPMLIDLDSPLHVALLEKILKTTETILLFEELLPIPDGFATEVGIELR